MRKNIIKARTCIYNVNYHMVWSVKYRHKILDTKIENRLKEIIYEIAEEKEFVIHEIEVGDEYGNFKEISNFNAMRSGQKSVLNPIAFKTTTAYEINNSIMETEDLPYIRNVLNGSIVDEKTFSLIYYAEREHLFDDIGMYQASPLRIEQNYEEVRSI